MTGMRLLAGTAVLLLAAGCSSTPSTAPDPAPATTPSATSSSSAPADTAPAPAPCPDGAYLVTGLEGRGEAAVLHRGTGGNITADFTAGTFTIASDGSGPMKVDLGPSSAELRLAGEITSTYAGDPSALQLTGTGARGDLSIKGFGVSRSYPASELADQLIGSSVTAQVTCDAAAGTAVVVLPAASLTLTRRG